MAHDALGAIRHHLPNLRRQKRRERMFEEAPIESMELDHLSAPARLRLAGRHGHDAQFLVQHAEHGELEQIPETDTLWAELRWAARAEGVHHLDDLLLRRVRLSLTTPNGAMHLLEDIRKIVQPELGWSDQRWRSEVDAYQELFRKTHQLPGS
jgi:glycerol-3-phosphate dehydrogenase